MKNILKYFSFFIILNFISCDDGYNNTQVNVIGSGIPLSSFKAVLELLKIIEHVLLEKVFPKLKVR